MTFKRTYFAVFLFGCCGLASAQAPEAHNHNGGGGKVISIPRDLELRLAVNALPPSLRDGATIRVMEPTGYTEARHGTNAFTCIVSRRGGNFYPVCFDKEGSRTILPAYEDDAMMRLKGMSDAEVESALAKGFADGTYRPPARAGIAYMLSPATYMFEKGKFNRTPPHTMFYAPFLTDADVGGVPGQTPFIDRPGPHGQFIVLAGKAEREKLIADSQPLINEVEKAIGLQ
jgi:hypothetical protein